MNSRTLQLGRAAYKGDPAWTRSELILALAVYEQMDGRLSNPYCSEYKQLSELLQTLPFYPPDRRSPHFRRPTGVAAKMGNFAHLDTNRGKRGRPTGISKETQAVWDEFSGDRQGLQRAARHVLRQKQAQAAIEVTEEQVFREGKVALRIHKDRERDSKATRQKKAQTLRETGCLRCEVCAFDFAARFGERGVGFAECHHLSPLAQSEGPAETRLEDLAIVCPNCHRMLHRRLPMPTLAELRAILHQHGHTA